MPFSILFFGFLTFPVFSANRLYFPTSEVNFTLPSWTDLPKPLPPIMKLQLADDEHFPSGDADYRIASESTSGLFLIEGDEVRLNAESFTSEEILTKHQSAVVSCRSGAESANASINLILTGDKINCEREKRNLCFWNGASYRIWERQPPTPLGQLSSPFFGEICKNYSVTYRLFKGNEYAETKRMGNTNTWILSTKKKMKSEKTRKIQLGVMCTVTSPDGVENFLKEFDLAVFKKDNLEIHFKTVYKAPPTNVVYENEKVATGTVSGSNGDLKFSMVNDTEGVFRLKCLRGVETFYECEVITKRPFHLKSTYTAYVQIEDASSLPGHYSFQNVTLEPASLPMERLSLITEDESFMLELKYPEFVGLSKRAVAWTRVAEPTLSGAPPNTEVRRRVIGSKIQFRIVSPGIFNITQTGGIVFVQNRNQLKESVYRVKISRTYPNGHRLISTMQVNVTDTEPGDSCEKPIEESSRSSCSEKRFKSDCERTCGVSSGLLRRNSGRPFTTSGCSWRSNDKPEKLSRLYETCSPDLSTCPDRFCDPLEALHPKICPQDCTNHVLGSANKDIDAPGIASATGVCSCDNRQKCLCALMTLSDVPKPSQRRKSKQTANDTVASQRKEAISAMKTSYADQCGTVCLLFIVAGSALVVFGTSAVLLMIYRRRLKKRCPNQKPLKEDMVNINYEEYVERPGDVLRPLTQTTTVKEIPEYFDKKWEFPRYRLTIEETIGEGEFGKVLKARAEGIGGHDGSTTVAVKTLKDSAKESELADLISEYQLLKEIDHPNVIHLLGACTKLDGPLYIIIEYAKHGSLRNYLRKHRCLSTDQLNGKESEGSYVQTITPKDILTFAWQIAKGMNYLSDMKLVHRDLAARNILVAEGLICKISDFGLTRDIYEDDAYLKRSKGRVPVKWMALESLADHVYTTKSDVWSYGVVLWELVTTGASPYPGIAGQDLFHLLKTGYRMEKPPNCSNELYQILKSCWHENPSYRPPFKSLVAKFEEMLGEGKDYLDLNPRTAENKTYFSELLWDEKDDKDERAFPMKFKMFDNPNSCSCPGGKCVCGVRQRYENENIGLKKKYENEGMEDCGYVCPTGKPKPVKECQRCSETLLEKMSNEAVTNVV